MKMTLNEMRQRRGSLVEQAQRLLDGADAEERGLTEEEEGQYAQLEREIEQVGGEIQRRERLSGWQMEMSQSAGTATRPDPAIGMNPRETRRYSLLRAINAAARGDWRGAQLEREASEATAQQLGREPQGFFVPYDYLVGDSHGQSVQVRTKKGYQYMPAGRVEQRDLVVGTDAAGGYLVDTDLQASNFIDMLRNAMMTQRAGARMLTGLVGDVAIPRQTGGATAYWVAESGSPTESTHAFDQVALAPKTVGAFSDLSRKLLKQSSIDAEELVRSDLATVLALEIDRAALHGSGSSNQPTGIAATSGIGSVAGGTDGLAPAWTHIVALETEVAQDNADVGRVAYMTNTKVRGKLKSVAVGTDQRMVWQDGGAPLNGYPAWITNQVSSALTKGSSSGVCSAIFFGNWGDLLIGMWGGLDILVDPYTGSTSGTVRVVALQDVDIAVRHPQSFAAMLDALTA